MYLGQLGFHMLSTPTLPEEGWGRQTVDTVLVNMSTGVVCNATHIRHLRSILTILVSIYHVRSIAVQAPASRALWPLPHIVTQVRVYILTGELTCSCLATRPPALPPPSLSSRHLTENEGNEDAEAFAAEETNIPCRVPEETRIPCASGGSAV